MENSFYNKKKIKNAKQQFKIALKSGENCETLSNLGDVYFMTDKLEKEIFNYQKALKINPNMNITLFS
ncbi:UDP-N-acetylglucosamine--peptide N-acetylglucosaminyltransferase 110 kDa subunit-like isoform X2, partial [Aphis craccivora]